MSRDWDKLRRQDRTHKPENKRLKFRRSKRPLRPYKPPEPKQKSRPPADIEKLLRVETSPPSFARWRRTRGQWRCIQAEPSLEWMLRVNNPAVIETWLRSKNLSKTWLPSHSDSTARSNRLSEERPADRPVDDSAPSGENNTTPSLNNATLAGQRDDQSARLQGLEQNGIANPRCLIRGEVPTTASP
jgi:hypothetical protein